MLLPRFLTALFGVPLLMASIWWGQIPFFLLVFGTQMLALHEFFTLAEESAWPVSKKLGLVCGAVLACSIFLFGTKMGWKSPGGPEGSFSPAAVSALFSMLIVCALFSRSKEDAFLGIAVTWMGIFYTVWTLSHIFLVRDLRPDGRAYTFFLFLVIWALDVGAYGGGMKFGKNKLSESISPKKTWEGVATGTAAALLTALLCQATFLRSVRPLHALVLGLAVALLAQLSDLSESLFKRNVRVKDSGSLLPGHGGILDRFDSFLLTAPVYYYLLVFFVIK